MRENSPRRRLRLHRSTWLVLLLAATALVLIIVPGQQLEPHGGLLFA